MESQSQLPRIDHTSQITYESLDTRASNQEIRLVTLEESDERTAVVRCSIHKTKLSPDCRYTALSYVWRDPPGTNLIFVNGTQIEVSKNLELALRHVRNETSERVIWVDAISINQADLAERSSQVMMMGQIFKQAGMVICWVGRAANGSDNILAALDISELSNSMQMTIEEGTEIDKRFLERSLDANRRGALEHFASATFWTRTWILQEITLAREIIILYGSASLPWHLVVTLDRLSRLVTNNPALSIGPMAEHPSFKTIEDYHLAVQTFVSARHSDDGQRKNDILTLLRSNSQLHATDMRDKLYGLFGLANDVALLVPVDYTMSVPAVYEGFTRTYIQKSHSLHIILHAGLKKPGSEQMSSLPTWVPDWSREMNTSLSLEESLYAAAKGMTHSILSSSLCNGLRVCSAKCDSISMFKPDLAFWGLEDFLFTRGPFDHPSGTPRLQAMFRSLTADCYSLSGKRFGDDTDLWFYHNSMGFLLDLGIQTNYHSEYAQFAMRGPLESSKSGTDPGDQGFTVADVDWRQHDFILAFRDWAESSIELLDDMIRRKQVPKPHSDGALNSKTLAHRVLGPDPSGKRMMEQAVFDITHLSSWKAALQKTRRCTSLESMLELFLGAPGSSHTTPWLETDIRVRQDHGAACWSRYYRNMASFVGDNSAFTTNSGYMGIGPKGIQANDEIHVLLGCNIPVALRPKGDRYMVLGPCSIHGLMDGEAIDLVNAGKFVLHDIELV